MTRTVHHRRGTAAALHTPPAPVQAGPGLAASGQAGAGQTESGRVTVLHVTGPAVVLGSTQDDGDVDRRAARAAGVDVVRRRSGGGAVWVAPGDPLWIDVVVPRDDRLWHDDVAAAFVPIGRAWATMLADLGVTGTMVHEGPLVETAWSRRICFAGTGPGEVLLDGRKLVGIAQRRSREGARFQCAYTVDPLPGSARPLLAGPSAIAGVGIAPPDLTVPGAPAPGTLDGGRLAAALAGALAD